MVKKLTKHGNSLVTISCFPSVRTSSGVLPRTIGSAQNLFFGLKPMTEFCRSMDLLLGQFPKDPPVGRNSHSAIYV